MISLDPTTRAAYDAATTTAAKSQAVLDALGSSVTVKVYDGSNALKGSGTMIAPWATRSGTTLTIGEVSSFSVSSSGTPDANWYLRFEGNSRWVRGSFGLSGSGQDFTWTLATWTSGQTGSLGTVQMVRSNSTPTWSGAPATLSTTAGATASFSAYASDTDGDALTFSLVSPLSGYSITSAGVLTVGSAFGSVTIRVSDGALYADHVCAVTVPTSGTGGVPASGVALDYDVTFESSFSPFARSATGGSIVAVDSTRAREGSKSLLTHIPTVADWRAEIELGWGGRRAMGQPTWYGWSLWLDSAWVANYPTWEVIGQWHAKNEVTLYPTMGFWSGYDPSKGEAPGRLRFFNSYTTNNSQSIGSTAQYDLGAITDLRGKWLDFVVYIVPSSTGTNGQLKVWMNGVLKVERANTPNYVNEGDGLGPYPKFGIYNGWLYDDSTPGVTERKAWWDCYRQVTSSSANYADVAPR